MDPVAGTFWIALCLIYAMASLFGESNAHVGGVVTALFAGFFVFNGWLNSVYLVRVISIVIVLSIIVYLRDHARFRYGTYGSSGGLVPKIMMFCMFLQLAVIFINGIAIFDSMQFAPNPTSEQTGYAVENADSVFGKFTRGESGIDQVAMAITFGWQVLGMLWSMVISTVTIFPWIVSTFHVPTEIAVILSAGFYMLLGLEIYMHIRPGRSVEP